MDSTSTYRPIRWTQGTGLYDFTNGAMSGQARGISANGNYIVGTHFGASVNQAFVWDAVNGVRDLGVLATFGSSAAADVAYVGVLRIVGVNNNGAVAATVWDENVGWRLVADILGAAGIDLTGWTLRLGA